VELPVRALRGPGALGTRSRDPVQRPSREQTACANPTIRYFAPYYYVIYGGWRWKGPGTRYEYRLPETKYVTFAPDRGI